MGRGGGDAVALVRVYCGLASASPPRQLAVGSSSLSATIVDDAGRILDVCELGDDSYGYAYLSALLAERATGPYSVAIAADHGNRLVPMLLATAGWALTIVDDESTDDLAERFADELSDDSDSAPAQRRGLGLARALQAGALSVTLLAAPTSLVGLKPVLAAHSALAIGRHAAAVALREVLRELYPAALRAYPDPADPVALAVMDALPEPGTLASS
ncbi:MAG: transposase, partial [Natronosporangium sp.]